MATLPAGHDRHPLRDPARKRASSTASPQEMEKLGYDKVEFDKLGNVIGWMGTGDKIIAIDSHIDTVGIGNRENWTPIPTRAMRPTRSSTAAAAPTRRAAWPPRPTARKIMKDLGLIPEGYKIMVVGSVQEEDCDGMCWQSIVNEYFNGPEDAQKPDRVRHLHRADRRRHLPRPPRPHGDPRRHARRLLPRLRARARRQRHPQDGRGHC